MTGWLASLPALPARSVGYSVRPRESIDGQDRGRNTERNRGNNDRIFIACNSIYTITHSIRSPTEK